MNTPDFTPAALAALLVSVVSAAVVLFNLNLTDPQRAALTSGIAAITTLGWFIHDAIVRHGRSNVAAAAQLRADAEPVTPDPAPVVSAPPVAVPRARRRT